MFITSSNFDLFKKPPTYKANVLLILSGRKGNVRVAITRTQQFLHSLMTQLSELCATAEYRTIP